MRGDLELGRLGGPFGPSVLEEPNDPEVKHYMMLLAEQESDIEALGLGLGSTTADDVSETTDNVTEVA